MNTEDIHEIAFIGLNVKCLNLYITHVHIQTVVK